MAYIKPVIGWPQPGSMTVSFENDLGDVTTFEAFGVDITHPPLPPPATRDALRWMQVVDFSFTPIGPVLCERAPWWRRLPRRIRRMFRRLTTSN